MRRLGVLMALTGVVSATLSGAQPATGFTPGQRTLLDAHNAYPERGQWTDRITRALASGTPIAIEQDVYWGRNASGSPTAVVAHDDDALEGAPPFANYFFAQLQPLMTQALRENRREQWPLVVLNIDFKQDTAPLLNAVWTLLAQHRDWLTTAPRTSTPFTVTPLTVGPMLVLVGADPAQRRRFHDAIPIGESLLAFGAMPAVKIPGNDKNARWKAAVRMTADQHLPSAADNYARWVNFPWSVIERGGQPRAGKWTNNDAARLGAFVSRAHQLGYWIRFYTLDGFTPAEDRGWTASYNFGSLAAVRTRWQAARATGVDFIATDQYEAFATSR